MFHTPVLKSKLNFKMQYLFAIADKTEMPRFDDTGMYGSYTHFVQFFTFDTEERIIGNSSFQYPFCSRHTSQVSARDVPGN